MAIYAYVGLPRNGKSYNVVAEQIIPALKEGRRVVTNIPLKAEGLAALGCVGEVVQIDQKELAESPAVVIERDMTAGSVVVLDELWRFIPQGMSAKNVDASWKTLFAEHGHRIDAQGRMMQIVLVTQDLSQVAAFARSLVERTFVVTKLTVIGSETKFRVDVYQGAVTGLKPPVSRRIAEQFGSYRSEVFACYESRTMAEAAAVGVKVNEKTFDNRATVWRHPAVRFGLPIAALLLAFGLWRSWHYFYVDPEAAVQQSEAEKAARATARDGGRVERRSRAEPRAERAAQLRVSGVLRAASYAESMVLLDRCDGVPGRLVNWNAAGCLEKADGDIVCKYGGQVYGFAGATRECRQSDERRSAEIQWFPAHDSGSREPVAVVPEFPGAG